MLNVLIPARTETALMPRRRSREAPEPETYGTDRTIYQALADTHRDRWQGLRAESPIYSQARTASIVVASLVRTERGEPLEDDTERLLKSVKMSSVESRHVTAAIGLWKAKKLAPGTINKRINCLGLMGAPIQGRRLRRPKVLKWWLKPDMEEALVSALRRNGDILMADYVTWATRTGLRVEESLKLTRKDFAVYPATGRVTVTVPGLKTMMAQTTLPLGDEAAAVFTSRLGAAANPEDRLFPISYDVLSERWRMCRMFVGASNDPLATLKALRRSAARYLHVERGMPLDMVRHYLRHENVATTMEYLRLTGGYGTDEFGKWL